jgi:hypothetical protein
MRYAVAALVLGLMVGCSSSSWGPGTETTRYLAGDTVAVSVVMPDAPDGVRFTLWSDGSIDQATDLYGQCSPKLVLTQGADTLYYAVGGFVEWSGVVPRNGDCQYDSVSGQVSCWGSLEAGDTIYIP